MLNSEKRLDIFRLKETLDQLRDIIDPPGASGKERGGNSWITPDALADMISATDATLPLARELYKLRRKREEYISSTLFADPAWDILLDLYVARLELRRASVKSVCIGSGVPATTALRWINLLLKEELIESSKDPHDSRVRCITLSEAGYTVMRAFFTALLKDIAAFQKMLSGPEFSTSARAIIDG